MTTRSSPNPQVKITNHQQKLTAKINRCINKNHTLLQPVQYINKGSKQQRHFRKTHLKWLIIHIKTSFNHQSITKKKKSQTFLKQNKIPNFKHAQKTKMIFF